MDGVKRATHGSTESKCFECDSRKGARTARIGHVESGGGGGGGDQGQSLKSGDIGSENARKGRTGRKGRKGRKGSDGSKIASKGKELDGHEVESEVEGEVEGEVESGVEGEVEGGVEGGGVARLTTRRRCIGASILVFSIEPVYGVPLFLLAREKKRRWTGNANFIYTDFGGGAVCGETPEQTAAREFVEESLGSVMYFGDPYLDRPEVLQQNIIDSLNSGQYCARLETPVLENKMYVTFLKQVVFQPGVCGAFRQARDALFRAKAHHAGEHVARNPAMTTGLNPETANTASAKTMATTASTASTATAKTTASTTASTAKTTASTTTAKTTASKATAKTTASTATAKTTATTATTAKAKASANTTASTATTAAVLNPANSATANSENSANLAHSATTARLNPLLELDASTGRSRVKRCLLEKQNVEYFSMQGLEYWLSTGGHNLVTGFSCRSYFKSRLRTTLMYLRTRLREVQRAMCHVNWSMRSDTPCAALRCAGSFFGHHAAGATTAPTTKSSYAHFPHQLSKLRRATALSAVDVVGSIPLRPLQKTCSASSNVLFPNKLVLDSNCHLTRWPRERTRIPFTPFEHVLVQPGNNRGEGETSGWQWAECAVLSERVGGDAASSSSMRWPRRRALPDSELPSDRFAHNRQRRFVHVGCNALATGK